MKKAVMTIILFISFKYFVMDPFINNYDKIISIFDLAKQHTVYSWVGLISNIFVALGVLFTAYEYWKQKKLLRIANAVEIANQFAKEVVDLISYVMVFFTVDEEIKKIIMDKYKLIENAKHFNAEELTTFFNEMEINKYLTFIQKPIDQEKIQANLYLQTNKDTMIQALNKIEHYSMSFNSKLADDKVVYQSLHQLLFMLIPYAYICIATLNVSNVDKYFCNTCELYSRWIKIRNKKIRKEETNKKLLKAINDLFNKNTVVKTPTT